MSILCEKGVSKTIALITGATGGIGKEFIRELEKENLDEIWVTGRSRERLIAIQEHCCKKIVPIVADLAESQDLEYIRTLLEEQNAFVLYLINNAGMGRMMPSIDFTAAEIEKHVKLSCTAPAILTNYCIPYMKSGSKIINLSSASAFQPNPYINLYASSKAFERSYSRGLNVELKPMGITVTAVCPSWVDTGLLEKEINGIKVKYPGIVSPEKVVKKAMRDAKRGKDMSVCSFYVKCQHLVVKLMPQKLTMKFWTRSIRKYL